MKESRALRADEIEVRPAQIRPNGASLLIYKDARCDMRILDETVGPMNWQRKHVSINGKLFCQVSIYDSERGAWITKEDTGTESNMEAEKGEASDSFKRACFNWGIGRELYTSPRIFIPASKLKITEVKNRKYIQNTLAVSKMTVKDKRITELEITADGRPVWSWKLEAPKEAEKITDKSYQRIIDGCNALAGWKDKPGSAWHEAILSKFPDNTIKTEEQAKAAIGILSKWYKTMKGEAHE